MTQERIEELWEDYKLAVERLKEALYISANGSSLYIDGTIQRFEFTFELAWKLLRAVLLYNAIQADTPRAAIKEAYKIKIINNGDDWISMLEDRNKTSHIYNEEQANEIYKRIKEIYYSRLQEILQCPEKILQ